MCINFKNLLYRIAILCSLISAPSALNALTPLQHLVPIHEAFVQKFTDPTPSVVAPRAPPTSNFESAPARQQADAQWISGYWAWVEAKNDYVWVCGVWRRPPVGHAWIQGSWSQNGSGWVWARGFWSRIPLEQLSYIEKVPPAAITDKISQSPGNNYFWAPGYWNYSANSKNYSWLSGKWELSNQDWVLAPACYIWRPSGYVFVPFYWDWSLEARGTAYSCSDATAPFVVIEPAQIFQSLFYCYPDYTIFYWHWWHFHPGWGWEGCGCVPPWWFWNDWWFFGWSDGWGLWWWWTHPGVFPPFWLSLELSLNIAPPPLVIIDFLKNLPQPQIHLNLGNQPLLPRGTPGGITPPFPSIPNNTTPGGQITLPPLPEIQVTLPPPPARPQTEPTYPSSQTPTRPTYPYEPEPPATYYPPTYSPPTYYPPEDRRPPQYYPPRDDTPPTRHPPHGHGNWNGEGNYNPPSTTYPTHPQYPTRPPQGNYTPPHQTGPSNVTPNYVPGNQGQGGHSRGSSPNYTPRNQGKN